MYKLYHNRTEKKRRRIIKRLIVLAVVVVLGLAVWLSWAGVARMLAAQAGGVSDLSEKDCKTVGKRGPSGSYHEVCETSGKRY